MKKKTLQRILCLVLIVLVIAAAAVASVIYFEDYRKTEVLKITNGNKVLSVYMVGNPDFPYGKTDCRLVIKKDGRKEVEENFSVRNDGQIVTGDNFDVEWKEKSVRLTVTGSEEGITSYVYAL